MNILALPFSVMEKKGKKKHFGCSIRRSRFPSFRKIIVFPKETQCWTNCLEKTKSDCWLVAAFACMTLAPTLVQRCIPSGQGFDDKYAGIFHFRFWRYGDWTDVIIDDKLPTLNGELIYLKSSDPAEFWPALFEKAYAKLYGSYENISGGWINWALQDITGGIVQRFSVNENPKSVHRIIDLSMQRASLMGASISIPYKSGTLVLIRLRNPWGLGEWTGPFSDGSPHWDAIDKVSRAEISPGVIEDGEMSLIDFSSTFTTLEVCHLTPECWQYESSIHHRTTWKAALAHRQWRRGYNAGGGVNSPLISSNCQFYLELTEPTCVIVSLMQKYKICGESRRFLPCSCLVYQVPKNRTTRLGHQFFIHNKLYVASDVEESRDNVGFFSLPSGCYVILPVTSFTGMEGKFLLRIFTDQTAVIRELDELDQPVPIQHARFSILNQYVYQLSRQKVYGKLSYEEFKELLHRIMGIFHKFSSGHTTMDTYGLRNAVKLAGFSVSNKTLEALVIRFAAKEIISIEGFVNALIKLIVAHQRYNAILNIKPGTSRTMLSECLRTAINS
ncbi:hypothetical protein KUTeg_023154 [Tegillarca granosa]|uniref:Calpain catalytic domain-containing protein n=1 Tax=Tegillarca granosa TaxID=220873 RepID=A0ABQ9E179_TEGGR|nr:hypothetical protein KUTeg_023154 [Tegillarca granosa]